MTILVKLLAFETSSQQGSVALQVDGNITEEFMQSPKQQTADLLPLAKKLLNAENLELTDLDGKIFKKGDFVTFEPGSTHSSHTKEGCLILVFMRGINKPL